MSTSCGTSRKYAIPEKGKKRKQKRTLLLLFSKTKQNANSKQNNTTNNVYESLPYKKVEMLSNNCPK